MKSGLSAEYILRHDSKPAHCFSAHVVGAGYVNEGSDPNTRDEYLRQLALARASQIESMEYASEYAEPGYTNPEKGILFANWNCFSRKIADVLERAGYAIEWSDEWTTCGECSKAVRTSPDSYGYTPYYVAEEGEIVCLDCIEWSSYLESIEDSPDRACMPQCDPAEYGYVLISDKNETGFHAGQDASPAKMLKQLQAQEKQHIVFRIDEQSQFYTTWQVWQKLSEPDEFTASYIECALWPSTDDSDEPLDKNYDVSDIAPEAMRQIIEDCARFQTENAEILSQADYGNSEYSNNMLAGHDFWLTRNRHGVGFWDRDLGDIGRKLTDAAHAFGECNLYIGDNGKLYL